MSFVNFISLWVPVFAWAALIFYLSSIPGLSSGLGVWDFFLRKGAHIFEYAVLTFLLIRAFVKTWPTSTLRKLVVRAGAIALLYAMSDEFHQSFVPRRGPSVHDVVIDSIGIGLACWFGSRHEI